MDSNASISLQLRLMIFRFSFIFIPSCEKERCKVDERLTVAIAALKWLLDHSISDLVPTLYQSKAMKVMVLNTDTLRTSFLPKVHRFLLHQVINLTGLVYRGLLVDRRPMVTNWLTSRRFNLEVYHRSALPLRIQQLLVTLSWKGCTLLFYW